MKIRADSFDPADTEDLEDLIVAAYRDAGPAPTRWPPRRSARWPAGSGRSAAGSAAARRPAGPALPLGF